MPHFIRSTQGWAWQGLPTGGSCLGRSGGVDQNMERRPTRLRAQESFKIMRKPKLLVNSPASLLSTRAQCSPRTHTNLPGITIILFKSSCEEFAGQHLCCHACGIFWSRLIGTGFCHWDRTHRRWSCHGMVSCLLQGGRGGLGGGLMTFDWMCT